MDSGLTRQLIGLDGKVDTRLAPSAPCRGRRRVDHFLDRSDSGDGVFRERESVCYCADELVVDVDRRAAHPGDDPGVLEVGALETGEDHVSVRAIVSKHAQYVDLERFDRVARKHTPAFADHPGTDVFDGDRLDGGSVERRREKQTEERQNGAQCR